MSKEHAIQSWSIAVLAACLTACGGGGDGGTSATDPPGVTAGAPTITVQPLSASANAGETLTLTVAATGTAPFSYQWFKNGTKIDGAVNATYSTGVLASTDNGAVFSVTVGNASGSKTSSNAAVAVISSAANSVLANRAWGLGVQLESGDAPVSLYTAGIDDNGNVTAVFVKSNGTRPVLYAMHGKPGAATAAPTWSPATAPLDGTGSEFNLSASFLSRNLSLAVAPNGNAHAVWISAKACTAQTYNPSTNLICKYIYSSKYLASTGTWEAPILVGDTPSATLTAGTQTSYKPIAKVNDRGDVAVLFGGWTRKGVSSWDAHAAVAWRSAAQSAFQVRKFEDFPAPTTSPLFPLELTLDNAGVMVLAGNQAQATSTNKDIIVYSGTSSAGFDVQKTVIDQLGADAQFLAAAGSASGEVGIAWRQNSGAADVYYVATRKAAASTWAVDQVGAASSADPTHLQMTGTGDALFIVNCGLSKWNKTTGAWAAQVAMPTPCSWYASGAAAFSNSGSYLFVSASTGLWLTYDIASNLQIHALPATAPAAAADYLMGVNAQSVSALVNPSNGMALLASNGVGAYLTAADFDVLPTVARPNGDGRASITNLWGLYLK